MQHFIVLAITTLAYLTSAWPEPPAHETWKTTEQEVMFEVIESDSGAGAIEVKRQSRVITSEKEWATLWTELHPSQVPRPPVPHINFNEQNVIIHVMGRSGFDLKIERIITDQNGTLVEVNEISPGQGCVVLAVMTNPWVAVAVPKSIKEPRFEIFTSRNPPCDHR